MDPEPQMVCPDLAHKIRGRGAFLEDPGQALNRTGTNLIWRGRGWWGGNKQRTSLR